jgi:hypothetical protein
VGPGNQPIPAGDVHEEQLWDVSPPTRLDEVRTREKAAHGIASWIVWLFCGAVAVWSLCTAAGLVAFFIQSPDLAAVTEASDNWARSLLALVSGPLGFVLGYYFRDRKS